MKIYVLLLLLFTVASAADKICTLRIESGPCRALQFKWGYDTGLKECRKFGYGGCGGNENKFETEEDCKKKCH